MVNNQLKNIYKKMSLWLGEKTYLKKKIWSQSGFARSRVTQRVKEIWSKPGFSRFLLIPVFYIIQTGIATGSIESRADLPGHPSLRTMLTSRVDFFMFFQLFFVFSFFYLVF
jgi:hypothetical protein